MLQGNNEIENKEAILVKALINDSHIAFYQLYTHYKKILISFSLKYVKSQDIAEDILQDTFTHIWQNRKNLNASLSFRSYIYTIIKNKTLDKLSNLKKEIPLQNAILENAIDYSHQPEKYVLDSELNEMIAKSLTLLTHQQRKVFVMSRNDQKSHKEIALELGITIPTVQQHVSDSLKKIRNYLSIYISQKQSI